MTQISNDIIVALSAVGGVVGLIYATISHVKASDKNVKQSNCSLCKAEIKSELKEESNKRENEDSVLHEKINKQSDRISKVEGILSKRGDYV